MQPSSSTGRTVFLLVAGLVAAWPDRCRAGDVLLVETNNTTHRDFVMDYAIAGTPARLGIGATYNDVKVGAFRTPDGAFTISFELSAANKGALGDTQSMAVNVTDSAGDVGSISLRYQQDYVLSPKAIGAYKVTTSLNGAFKEKVPPAFPHGNDIKANATLTEPGAENQSSTLLEGIDRDTGAGPWTIGPITNFNFLAPESVKINQTFDFEGKPAAGDLSQTPFEVSLSQFAPEPSALTMSGIALAIGLLVAQARSRQRGDVTG
jgi:hypothetical protein